MTKLLNDWPKWRSALLVHRGTVIPTAIILVLWLIVGALGISTSSLGLNYSVAEKNTANVIHGEVRPIRSDEWLRSTPYAIGRLQPWWDVSAKSPLEANKQSSGFSFSNTAESVIFFEQAIVERAHSYKVYVLAWWLPLVGVLIFGYLFFRKLGLRRSSSWLGPILIVCSGPVAWWSLSPLEMFYPAFAGSFLLLCLIDQLNSDVSRKKRWATGIPLALCAAIFLARMPFLYAPWSIPITALFAVTLITYLVRNYQLSRLVRPSICILIPIILLGYAVYRSRSEMLRVMLNTVYPGQRRSTGGDNPLLATQAWSGPYTWFSQTKSGAQLVNSNLSEVATGLTTLLIPTVLVLGLMARRSFRTVKFQVAAATTATLIFCYWWSIFSIPDFLLVGKILAFSTPTRIVQMIGLMAVIPFVLVWDLRRDRAFTTYEKLFVVAAALATGVVTLRAGNGVREHFFTALGSPELLLTASVVTLIVSALFLFRHWFSSALLITVALLSVAWVNPITVGAGDLVNSPAARVVQQQRAIQPEWRWATDDYGTDALIAATGAKMFSGQQGWGPNKNAWTKLDQSNQYIDIWNRGAAFLLFQWEVGIKTARIESPQADMIRVFIDPCDAALSAFTVNYIVSSRPLDVNCLRENQVIFWSGIARWIYSREPAK